MKPSRQMIWLPIVFVLISLACATLSPVPPNTTAVPVSETAAPPTLPPLSLPALDGVIAYASDRDGLWQIMAMNADGSDETSLTAGLGTYSRPAWSPDGKKIAMRMEIDMGSGIAVMDLQRENGKLRGMPPTTVINAFADGPRWSPDGTKLIFVMTAGDSGGWLTHIADISNASTTPVPGILQNATNPDWAPNGNQIVFSYYTNPSDQMHDIYVINTDGSGLVKLTNTLDINEDEAIWSPDGSKIVFTSYAKQENGSLNKDIFVMNSDGTNVVRVTTDPGGDFDPSWSPDGKQIVFVSDRHENNDGNYEVYVINADGTGELRLTNNHSTDRWPTWRARQPDDVVSSNCQPGIAIAADVTIPSGTRFATPQPFSKVWRLKNSGTCTWTPTDYALRFVDGEQMGGSPQVMMPGAIQPGATVDLVIPQVAPDAPGRHVGHWQLARRDGQVIPGPDGNPVTLAVDIEVLQPNQVVLPKPLYFLSEQSGSAQVWRVEPDAHTLTQVTSEYQPVVSYDVSSNGRFAFVSQSQVIVTDKSGQNRKVVASLDPQTFIFDLAWSSDGNRLAYPNKGIYIYDASTEMNRLLIADTDTKMPGLIRYEPLEWSPDGSKLTAFTHLWEGAEVNVISIADGTILAKLPWETTTWNRDSQSVYVASSSYPGMAGVEPGLWRGLTTGEALQSLIQGASIWHPIHRPDGSLAFFMHQPTTPETREYAALLYAASQDGSQPNAVNSWPVILSLNDRFDGAWTDDGNSILLQLERPALKVNEVLLLSADANPPLFLMPEIREFQWGN